MECTLHRPALRVVHAMVHAMRNRKRAFKSPKTFSGKEFQGLVLEPIRVPFVPPPTGNDEIDARLEKLRTNVLADANRQLLSRIYALLTHYEIPIVETGETLFRLVKALSEDFLPG